MDRGRRHLVFVTNMKVLRRSCFRYDGTPKVRWPNPTSARFVADLSNFRRDHGRPWKNYVESYRCRVCDGWHVARPPLPEWYHTAKERREDLLVELGIRPVAWIWRENTTRIRAEAGDTRMKTRWVRRVRSARGRVAA